MVFGKRKKVVEEPSNSSDDDSPETFHSPGPGIRATTHHQPKEDVVKADAKSKPLASEVVYLDNSEGKKAQIQRCQALLKNREEYERIKRKVQEAEKAGTVSLSLKNSVLTKMQKPFGPNPLQDSFSTMERSLVDMKISEDTTLLDECKRDVEKDLALIKDTWYTQRVSIVSDGWSNIKHEPLINVIATNSRGAMFMYAEDFRWS
ncbi:hypothetical protein COLO4_37695 [Corchorus olitorius]|uniref:DUF659 domain-containing protein n=1 Tax=Corchorus olitorius TaxID=93759 RepID=A0A1R3FZX4_9ROSI|nr:hypothetical protein COLO4_37695 [Corchorus olitorius]